MSPTRYFAMIIASALLMLPACKKKDGEDSSARGQAQAAQDLEEVIPGDVDNALLIRDFTAAFSGIGPLIDRAEAFVGDLSPIEADLRNTLGIDVRHPEQLRSIGIEPSGQAIMVQRAHETIIATQIADADKFAEHVTSVLQGAPFSLRGPVSDESQSEARILQFRQDEGEPVRAGVVLRDGIGIILMSSNSEPPRLEDFLADPESSLANNEQFESSSRALEEYPIVIWGDPEQVYARRPGDLAIAAAQEQLETLIQAARTGGLGLSFMGDRLLGEFALAFDSGEKLEELKSVYVRGDEAPTFAGVATTDAYAITRLVIDPALYMRTAFERLVGIDPTLDAAARKTALDGIVERDFDETVVPAIGTHLLLANTRARIITLSTAAQREGPKRISDFTESFGLLASAELNERAPVVFVIDKLIEKGHLDGSKREQDGTIIYDLSEAGDSLGALVLEEQRMTFIPKRQARELTAKLLSGEAPELDQFRTEEARTLAGRTNDAGIAIDVDEVLNGPFGNLMGNAVPDQLRSTFNLIDEAWIRWSFQQDTLRAPFQILVSEPPAP